MFSKNYYGPGVYKEGNLGLAIASATGLSQGAAQTVPTLLMPDANSGLDSRTLLERFPYESCVIEIEAGESCYKVCSTGTKRLDELWISMNDFAVRRYREKSTFIPEYCERTIAAMVPFDAAEAEEFRQRLHVNNCTWYERVVFDEPIDQAVFNGPAD